MPQESVLVTGGTGCIGSWVVRNLLRAAVPVLVLTAGRHEHRLRLVLTEEEFARIGWVEADIADVDGLERACRDRAVDTIIHLAGMQLPLCAADPLEGARVNVAGTIAMFELARRLGIPRLTFASSAAVYGPKSWYRDAVLPATAEFYPTSHYGVFKIANEQGARIFWETLGISSVGLRPHSVYGPGRDRGVTSKPTAAMIAAAAGRPYHINFGGRYQFQFADDAARVFLAAARSERPGASVFSLAGPRIGVDEVIAAIEAVEPAARGTITFDEKPLALPEAFDGAPVEDALGALPMTALHDGVAETIDTYRRAIRDGRIDAAFLDQVLAS